MINKPQQQNQRELGQQWKSNIQIVPDKKDIEELKQLINDIIPSGEYNEILEQLGELYKQGEEFDDDIIKKLQEYNPFLFEIEQECLNDKCVITQKYPRLLEHRFSIKINIQKLQQESFKIILFNTLHNITGQGRYFQENINIPDMAPVPDENKEMFIDCQAQSWETKIINEKQTQIKIALYYDDYHILLCEDIIEDQRLKQLTKSNIVFKEDVLQFTRYLNRIQQIPIKINTITNASQSYDYLMNIYDIPEELQQALLQVVAKQDSTTIISSVGEGLRFQDLMQERKKERK